MNRVPTLRSCNLIEHKAVTYEISFLSKPAQNTLGERLQARDVKAFP